MASDAIRAQVAAKWQDSFARLNHNERGISGLMEFSQAWRLSTDFLRPRHLSERVEFDMQQVASALKMVSRCRRLPVLMETFLEDIRKQFHFIVEEVNEYLSRYQDTPDSTIISDLVFRIVEWYKAWFPFPDFGGTIVSAYTLTFHTQLFAILPPSFAHGFKALCASTLPASASASNTPHDPALWSAFELLGLVDRYESLIASVGYEHIEKHVNETCKELWAEPVLPQLRDWMSNVMVPWMLGTYARGAQNTEEARAMLQGVGARFDFHMNKTLCDLRTDEIFDIIIDFPDSMGALKDLKECLQRVDQRAALVYALRRSHKKRLLHPGADTKLILSQYVASIKCLRIIDPPGVLLFKVADPIRRYLRDRPDTIRSIVSNLVGDDETGDSLIDDAEPPQPLQQSEVEDYADPGWDPEPMDAGPEFRTNKTSDVISTLVSIYDSKDLFVKELQVLLAQRLLAGSARGDNVEKERRNIEILKIRFGEAALQVCEVMLKDMTDSKRIDVHVQSQKPSIVHPTIISRHFWPALDTSDISMPGQFKTFADDYSASFSTFKPDKKLRWLPHLGTVDLELVLEDRTINATVPPLEAAFIQLYSEQDIWRVDEIAARVRVEDRTAALKALLTWVDLGVLKEDEENQFRLLERKEERSEGVTRTAAVPTESDSMSADQQQQAEQMRIHWNFIEGMLRNLGTLPTSRIQTMLKFAPGYDRSIEQLGAFMEAARREGLVVGQNGVWRLNR